MSVIEGEGRVPIMYRSFLVPGTTDDAYLARPDLEGRFPGLLLVPTAADPAAVVKDFARRLARYEFAVAVPGPDASAVAAAIEALDSAWRAWTAPGAFGVIALGAAAGRVPESVPERSPLVLLSPLGPPRHAGPTLVLGPEGVKAAGALRVTYRGVGERFWDDSSPDYHPAAARDAFERIVEFLERQLAAKVPA